MATTGPLRDDTNAIGHRGERIFDVKLTRLHGHAPLFRPAPLGEKWPVADFAVELVGHPGCFFLVQVKATRQALTATRRLRISVSKNRFNALARTGIPAYVVGVDERRENAYIVAALNTRATRLTNLRTSYSLADARVRQRLFDEVLSYWDAVRRTPMWRATRFGL